MPQPSQNQVHVDTVLTDVSVAYIQDQSQFIATKVFPIVPVMKQTDKYYKYSKDDWFKDEAQKRADASESAGSGYNLGTDGYSCDVYAFHKDVGRQTRRNVDAGINLDSDATRFVTNRLLLKAERQFVAEYFKTGVWDTDVVGTTDFAKWSDYATSDPIEDIEDGKEQILKTTGYAANTLVVGYQVWRKLKNHPAFVDRIKYTTSDAVSKAIVARYLEVDNIYVAQSIFNSANEGAAGSYDFVFGKDALLCHVAPAPGLLVPSAGYVFSWSDPGYGTGTEVVMTRFFIDEKKADRIEGEMAWDNKVVATDMGYFFSGAVA